MRQSILWGALAMTALTPVSAYGADALVATTASASDDMTVLSYPKTKTVPQVDEQFGVKVADPYRWLEDDVRTHPEVADWAKAENAVTQDYLKTVPGRDVLAARMKKLFDYERIGLPQKAGKHYFYTKNDGLQNQSVLYVRDGLNGTERALIDPNSWAKDGATALDAWVPSKDGNLIAYSVQDGGSDWRTIHVLNVKTGAVMADEMKWSKFSGISWIGNEGIIYSRFPAPRDGAAFQSLNKDQTVYYHKIGTPQSADQVVYATPDFPDLNHTAEVTQDGRWMVITSSQGTDEKYELSLIDIISRTNGNPKPETFWISSQLVKGLDHSWQLIDGIGEDLYFVTNKDAARQKVVRVNLVKDRTDFQPCYSNLSALTAKLDGEGKTTQSEYEKCIAQQPFKFHDIIPERAETLSRAQIVGDRLILNYMKDAKSTAEMTDLTGKPVREITLNSIGTASGFSGKIGDPETFYNFSSFNQPGAVYRFDSKTAKTQIFAQPKLSFNPSDYAVEQHFYPSKDGTQIPMFIVYKKGIDLSKGAPTLLYAYGGFNAAQTPSFNAAKMAWIQSGGVYALANIRGGGEYGKPWHDAGRLLNKQNVFDDFIAAGEYLIAKGFSAKGKLAIEGRSNGGLLIGAVVNQRPDLFAAAHAAVGVMDMLRFDRFTAGRYWVDDYGYPEKEADFKNLLSYSPYHNIKSGVAYPAVIASTADTDDRVVPGHSFKYMAALQAADTGNKPHIIRIESRAGHGSGKPTDKLIEEYSDIYAFLAKWTGLELKAD